MIDPDTPLCRHIIYFPFRGVQGRAYRGRARVVGRLRPERAVGQLHAGAGLQAWQVPVLQLRDAGELQGRAVRVLSVPRPRVRRRAVRFLRVRPPVVPRRRVRVFGHQDAARAAGADALQRWAVPERRRAHGLEPHRGEPLLSKRRGGEA